jgi:seryl-tRNA(Sec) selenium transferase
MGNLRLGSSKLEIVCRLRSGQSGKTVAKAAIAAVAEAVRHAIALEYGLDTSRHGEREDILRDFCGN